MKMISVLNGKILKRPPIWIMRQAGRYLPEYRQLRLQANNFIDFCLNPRLAVEATLQPLRRFDLDAAIIFSDILTIPYGLGQVVEFIQGDGPRLGDIPQNITSNINSVLTRLEAVYEAITRTRQQLPADKPLIGFAGAPWTVMTYMCEGGSSKTFEKTKQLCWGQLDFFKDLLQTVISATVMHLSAQIKAGANVVQIFDSWSGNVPAILRDQLIYQPTAQIVHDLRILHPHIPIIGFPRGLSHLLDVYVKSTGVTAVGLDAYSDPDHVNCNVPLQGGLDPVMLLVGGQTLRHGVQRYLTSFANRPYIFNLGHGILPTTPIDNVHLLLKIIDEHDE